MAIRQRRIISTGQTIAFLPLPVILNPAQYNPAHYNRAQLQSMLIPYAGSLETYRISCFVNSPGNDGPECVEPVSD
jgi:putative SOS response-associated peptidase YedK